MDAEVTLVIKSANQVFSDHRVTYHTEWTVLELKQEINITHPGVPSVPEQRLIYSGQLLQDHLTLKEVLRHPPENNAYTIHMVSSSPKKPPVANLAGSVKSREDSSVVGSQTQANSESIIDGVRRRIITSESSPVIQSPGLESSGLYPHFSQFPSSINGISDPLQQMEAMQQMYAQYMASYMQYMQTDQQISTGNSSIGVNSDSRESNSNLPPAPVPNNPPAPQIVPNRVAVPPQGAAEDEEDGVPRDWLDYIYFASRMGVLLSIVYFYSTFTRFMLIIVIFIGFYLYQGGWFVPNAGRAPARVNNNNNNQQAERQRRGLPARDGADLPAPEVAPAQRDEAAPADNDDGHGEAAAPPPPEDDDDDGERNSTSQEASSSDDTIGGEADFLSSESRPSILTLSWTFLTTFFTSLIPENNQIIA